MSSDLALALPLALVVGTVYKSHLNLASIQNWLPRSSAQSAWPPS